MLARIVVVKMKKIQKLICVESAMQMKQIIVSRMNVVSGVAKA
jgi:hypothetical protein